MNVHIAVISHKHGVDTLLAKSEQGMTDQLYDFVKDCWRENMGDIPEDKQEAISEFFDVAPELGIYMEYQDSIDTSKIHD